jgi:hypothetical protein
MAAIYDLTRLAKIAQDLDDPDKICAITVALKISDNSCKMDEYEKSVFMSLYQNILKFDNSFFDNKVQLLLQEQKQTPEYLAMIKENRELAMEHIGRPKMKAFKAKIRKLLS